MQRWITLYTDANPRGWGAWARAGEGHPTITGEPLIRQKWSGRFDAHLDTTAAEALAIIHGCERVLSTWTDVYGVGVKTDSQAAMHLLKYRAKPHRRADLRELQIRLRETLGASIHRIQWVKGHQRDGSVSAWLNNQVDALAAKYSQ